ncbi:MAG: hypothetical protein HC893_07335, partial [Chloroflexaceae bacterium]|nr:hypothetical protein [Chloroflexaceae bacterium]
MCPAIGLIVAVDRGDDGVLEPHVALAFDPANGRMIPGSALAMQPVLAIGCDLGLFDPVGATGLRFDAAPLPVPDSVLPSGPIGAGGGFTDAGP